MPVSEPEEDDEDDTDLVELPNIEEPLVEEAPPEEEVPPEEVKLDEKFAAYFEKSTGMPMAEFGETMHEIKTVVREIGADGLKEGIAFIRAARLAQQIEEVRSEADKLWNVDRAETNKRLEVIKPYFDRLSKSDQKLYDNPKGADVLWRSVQRQTGGAKTKTSKGTTSPTGKRFLYSQSEIDAMPKAEYEKHADRITAAYNKNLVGE